MLDDVFIVFFGWLVWRAAQGFRGRFGSFLQLRPIAYCGKISYAIYVLHLLSGFALDFLLFRLPGYRLMERLHISPGVYNHPAVRLPLLAAITLSAAALSWKFYEGPLNNLKRFFPYSRVQSSVPVHSER
jgi:peptidoglycan/LPS O-acetylase OafA/YrhL